MRLRRGRIRRGGGSALVGVLGVICVPCLPALAGAGPATLRALPGLILPEGELRHHFSPSLELARRMRARMRALANESVEMRSFGDDEIQRRLEPSPATGSGGPVPYDTSTPDFFGLTQISESNQPPCHGDFHSP